MSQFYAVNAKLKAMSKGFLSGNDYEALLSKNGVSGVCGYLKNNTVYSSVLAGVNEEDIHRTELEKLIEKEYYQEYIRIFKFIGLYERKVFNFYIISKEIEYIKYCVEKVFGKLGEGENTPPEPDEFFLSHTKLNLENLMKAEDFYSVMDACRGSVYYNLLYREDATGLSPETVVMMLEIYYYKLLWSEFEKFTDKQNKSDLTDLLGKKIDLLNILWVYRCKKYFKISDEMIYTHIIPVNYKMTRENLADIVSGDISHLVNVVSGTRYGRLFDNIDSGAFPEENYKRIMYDITRNKFLRSKGSMTVAVAYIMLKRNEMQNIKTITEGKRYSSNTDTIRELIVY